jgi:hypothetical protein
MRKSNENVWTFFPDARCGRNDSWSGDRYRYGVMYDVLLDDGQTTGYQIDPFRQERSRIGVALRATCGPGGGSQADSGWIGSYLALWRESAAGFAQARLPGVPVTSGSDACLRSTTEVASENGSARCGDDCASTARDGEARFGYVPGEQVATYRELMRLQHQREPMMWCATTMRSTRGLWSCSPNSRRSRYDPTRPTALAVLKRYPSAQAIAQTEVESRSRVLA